MKVLLIGASGQVGHDCAQLLAQSSYTYVALTRNELDFADGNAINEVVQAQRLDVIINACAYTAVDKAQTERVIAEQVNATSVGVLAKVAQSIGAVVIHLSTDYVFDGQVDQAYTEEDNVNPLGVYGLTKYQGEQALRQYHERHIILRTSWVFGKHGNNFVKTMLRLGQERQQLNIVADQIGRPTYAMHIAQIIMNLIKQYQRANDLPWGTYHCSGHGVVSWYEFAQAIFDLAVERGVLASSPELSAIGSSAYPTPAPRPAYSVLNTQKLEVLLGEPMPQWQHGLCDFFDE